MDIKQPTTIPFWKFSLTEWYKGMLHLSSFISQQQGIVETLNEQLLLKYL